MISIKQCKKLISDKTLTDAEVEQVRDELYILANLAFEQWRDKNINKKNEAERRTLQKP